MVLAFDKIKPLKTEIRSFEDIDPIPLTSNIGGERLSESLPGLLEGNESDKDNLAMRGLKGFLNVLPETGKEVAYGVGGGKISSWITAGLLKRKLKKQGIKPPSLRQIQKMVKQRTTSKLDVPEFDIKPAETVGEKAVDVAVGIGKFATKLAVLKKAFPGVSEAALWEMENLSSGGTPGIGLAMNKAFSVPGKLIKGTSKVAKAGRLATESGALGSISALEQKITTGEVDWKSVAVAAGIPVALRSAGYIKSRIRAKDPKVLQAVQKTLTDKGESEILQWANKAKFLNKTQRKAAVKLLRKQQAKAGREQYKIERKAGTPRLESLRRAKGAFKGKASVPEIEPLKLTPVQKEFYGKRIEKAFPENRIFQRTGAADALNKMERGKIPTNYEFSLLEPILGQKTTEELYTRLASKRSYGAGDVVTDVVQGLKSIFGLDIQVFRQARSFAVRHPLKYTKAAYTNIRAYKSQAFADKAMTRLKGSPGYKDSTKYLNYVSAAPYSSKRLEYFRLGLTEKLLRSKNRPMKAYGRLLRASERGATAGIDTMMKSLWDASEKRLAKMNLSPKQAEIYRINRGKTINTFMNILRTDKPSLRKLQTAANYVLFSPSMTVSRPLSIKAVIRNKGSRQYAGEILASNIASIFATASIPALIGHQLRLQNPSVEPVIDGELNPLAGSWGKIRVGNDVIDFSGGDAPFYRTLARIGVSAYMAAKGKITDEPQTTIGGKTIPTAGETITQYIKSRETAAIGLAQTLLTGKDWLGRPIPRYEALVKAVTPEIITSVVEAGMADGLWEQITEGDLTTASKTVAKNLPVGVAAFASLGTASYAPYAASTRSEFKQIIAQKEHGKKWEQLTQIQQKKLQIKHRKDFQKLDEQVKVERSKQPFVPEKIIEEERKSGVRINKMLSKKNRKKMEGISMGVSRSPKKFYLNDKRYNKYQKLVANELNSLLNGVNLEGRSAKVRRALLEARVSIAKKRAFITLKKDEQF